MNKQPFARPTRWWSPRPSRFWMRFWRPYRRYHQIHHERILDIRIEGLEHVRWAMDRGHGVLITPNHPGHGDCYLLWEALEKLRTRVYVMTAWQVFEMAKPMERMLYRQHGCFSVNREGNDLQAFKQAVQILQTTSYPFIIFPEGEVYHLNDRLTPFREGTASIALAAVKRGKRPVSIIPCALRYQYLQDPSPELHEVMDELEERLYWRPRRDLTLSERIYRVAEGILRLKELEYLGHPAEGTLPERTRALADEILARLEARYEILRAHGTTPERVKEVRHQAIERRRALPPDDPTHEQIDNDLDDLFFVVQLFSYPGDYVSERPTIERMAETVDKFEEDFLDRPTANVRGTRRGRVTFGAPITVTEGGHKATARQLTLQMEACVQRMLDGTDAAASRLNAS